MRRVAVIKSIVALPPWGMSDKHLEQSVCTSIPFKFVNWRHGATVRPRHDMHVVGQVAGAVAPRHRHSVCTSHVAHVLWTCSVILER